MMSNAQLPQRTSPVVNLQESWTQMSLRLLRDVETYLRGPGPRQAIHTYRWVLAGILAALLVAAGHWGYWLANTDTYDGLKDKREITHEGFEIRQGYTGYADGDSLIIRGRIDEVTVIENFSYGPPATEYDGIRSVNVADVTSPTFRGVGINTLGEALDLAVAKDVEIVIDAQLQPPQDLILVADGRKGSGLLLLSDSDPLSLTQLARFSTSARTTAVAVTGTIALVGDDVGGLTLVDFSKFDSTEQESLTQRSYRLVGSTPVLDVHVVGDIAYLALGEAGLGLVNISNPDAPSVKGTLELAEGAYNVFVQDGLAYVSGASAGLQFLNVTNASNPVELTSLELNAGILHEIVVEDQLAYLAVEGVGLEIYNVSDVNNTSYLGGYRTNSNATGLRFINDLVFLAAGDQGLLTLNVRDPANVIIVGQVRANGATTRVGLANDKAYINDHDNQYHFSFVAEEGFPFDFVTENNTLFTIDDFTFMAQGNLSEDFYENDLVLVELEYRVATSAQITGFVDDPYYHSFDNLTLYYGYFNATDISLSWEVDHYFYWLEGLLLFAGPVLAVATSPRIRQELKGASKVARFEIINQFSSIMRTFIIIIMLAFFVVGTAWGVAGRVGATKEGDSFFVADANEALILITHFTFFILSLFTLVSAFNIIVRERLGNTLNLLLCRPLNRPGILLGKLAALQVFIGLPALISTILALWIINNRAGEYPATGAALGYIIFTQVMIFTFLVLQANLSVTSRNPTSAAFMGIGVWVTFALLWSLFRLALAFTMGLEVGAEDIEKTAEFQALAGRMAMLNPGEVYDFTVGLMLPRGANDNIEGIPRWAPPVAMLLWPSALLWLATVRFDREKQG